MTNLYYLGVVVSVSVSFHDVSAQAIAISVSMFYPPRGFRTKGSSSQSRLSLLACESSNCQN